MGYIYYVEYKFIVNTKVNLQLLFNNLIHEKI